MGVLPCKGRRTPEGGGPVVGVLRSRPDEPTPQVAGSLPVPPRRGPGLTWRRAGVAAVVVAALAVVGGQVGRAETVGNYRPILPGPPLQGVCWPLPGSVSFEFPFQLRSDRPLVEPSGRAVRRLDMHVDLVDAAVAVALLADSLLGAGFREIAAPTGADPEVDRWFVRPDYGRVGVAAESMPGIDDDSIVRARMLVDLPADSETPSAARACSNPVQTKQWPAGAEER